MKRFWKDIKRYMPYAKYATKSGLKSEVASSHLSWLWWILDLILFMLVYWFIFMVIWTDKKEYFHIFVFVGLSMWNLFNKTVSGKRTDRGGEPGSSNESIYSQVFPDHYSAVSESV